MREHLLYWLFSSFLPPCPSLSVAPATIHPGWNIKVIKLFLHRWPTATHQILTGPPLLLKILEPMSFLLSHSHCTVHHLFLVYVLTTVSYQSCLCKINAHSVYQTFADPARAIVYKHRALILSWKYTVVSCFTKSKPTSSVHPTVIYLQTLSIFIFHYSLQVLSRWCCHTWLSIITQICVWLPS